MLIPKGGGSPPSGAMANVPANSGAAASQGYMAGKLNAAQVDLIEAQRDSVSAQAAKTRAETSWIEPSAMADIDLKHSSAGQSRASIENLNVQAKKIGEEIKNIPLEGERLKALVTNLGQSSILMDKQGLTQEQQAIQLKWLARKAMLDGDLTNLDIKAASAFDNLGREAGQLKPIIDIVMQLLRR